MLNKSMANYGNWIDWVQWATALGILIIITWRYRIFIAGLLRFFSRYLGLTVVLAVLYLMVFGYLGSGLGIPYLFWHDDFPIRAFSSAGATMLLVVVGVIAYYLDSFPWATDRKTAVFLRADEQIKRRIVEWYSHWFPMVSARPDASGRYGRGLRWWDYLAFAMNTTFDPTSITPAQAWLEPDTANSRRLQRFLRTARTPFLLLLLAPSVLPAVFAEVPRGAPTGKIGLESLLNRESPPLEDVSRHFAYYLLGVAAWLLGIQAGVLIIKIFIRLSNVLNLGRAPEQLVPSPLGGQNSWITPDPHCPHAATGDCPRAGCPRSNPIDGRSCPSNCAARTQIRVAALTFALLFLGTYVVLGVLRHLREAEVPPRASLLGLPLFDLPPAFAICMVLAMLAMVYAAVASIPRACQLPVALLLLGWFGYANKDPYKYKFEKIDYQKSSNLFHSVEAAYNKPNEKPPENLKSDLVAREAWKAFNSADGGEDIDGKGRPKMVLVAVSGGATRSAYWTAVVLDKLEQEFKEPFGKRVRIITGASGGMMGAACYVTYRKAVAEKESKHREGARDPAPGLELTSSGLEPSSFLPNWIRKDLPLRSMEPLARGIALAEIWNAAWPGTVSEDRGVILEKSWPVLRYHFVALAPLEEKGQIPSLIFSPMIVEDGRRLLISNLELSLEAFWDCEQKKTVYWAASPLIQAAGQQIAQASREPKDPATIFQRHSLPSLEYFRILPEEAHRYLDLSTAVRMSATFPFVSPAVNLPTDPPRRVVDAGYYDNYGIQVAASWIRWNRDWLAENTSGVLLVQIRDSSSVRDRLNVDDTEPDPASRGFQFVTSPIDAVSKARYTTASFRNDADVATLDSTHWDYKPDRPTDPAPFFTTAIFENSAEVSLDPGEFWDELAKLYKFDLELLPPVKNAADIPSDGRKNKIIVAAVDNVLHFCIFDAGGKIKLRTDETKLPDRSRQIGDIRRQLANYWPPREMTDSDKAQVVDAVVSMIDPVHFDRTNDIKGDFREVSMSWYLTRAEMAATAAAIPSRPEQWNSPILDWKDWQTRKQMMDQLNGDVSYFTGRDRAIRQKRLDQLYNYERLINLHKWWTWKSR